MGHTAAEHYEIIIDDSALTKHGFTKFSLPLNGNGTRMVVHNTDKRKMIYPTFYKSDLGKTVQSLRDKIVSDGILIDDDTTDGLVAYFRNTCVLLSEDQDSPFFKNGNGNGNGNGKAKTRARGKAKQQGRSVAVEEEKPADYNIIISFEQWQTKLIQKYNKLYSVVQNNLPHLWPSLEFSQSIKNILHIKDCTLPFAGIILGPPSSLKTVTIDLLKKSKKHIYHTHHFSPRSLVSHMSGLSEEELQKNDLLPKIKNKCLLTPELAPTFAAKDDDLLQFIGILTSVLDGHGYGSDSGVHGHRGYDDPMMFTWIGAAVNIPFKVHKLLTTLGPKLYFFRVARTESQSDEIYYKELQDNDFDAKTAKIQEALTDYQTWFEAACPTMVHDDIFNSDLRKMRWISSDNDGPGGCQKIAYMYIIKLAKLLAHLRAVAPTWNTEGTQGSEYGYTLPTIEEPNRAMKQLVNLARGHALLKGRNYVSKEDIPLIVKVVLSTAPVERITIFDILLANNGSLTVNQITQSLDVSEKTAQRTMLELRILGLVSMEKIPVLCSDGITRLAFQIRLKDEFNWFLSEEFKKLREGFKPDSDSTSTSTEKGNGTNGNGPDDDNSSSRATTGHIGRPKTDWKNVLEDKATEEKYPPEKEVNNDNNNSSNNVTTDNNSNSIDSNNVNMPLPGGKISSTAYSLVDSSSEISEDYDLITNGEVIIPDSIYRLGHSDRWACKNCKVKGDKWFMLTHPEYCKAKSQSKQSGGEKY